MRTPKLALFLVGVSFEVCFPRSFTLSCVVRVASFASLFFSSCAGLTCCPDLTLVLGGMMLLADSLQVISSSCISRVVVFGGVGVKRSDERVVVMGEAEVELCLFRRFTTQAMASILGVGGGSIVWLVLVVCGVLVNL